MLASCSEPLNTKASTVFPTPRTEQGMFWFFGDRASNREVKRENSILPVEVLTSPPQLQAKMLFALKKGGAAMLVEQGQLHELKLVLGPNTVA